MDSNRFDRLVVALSTPDSRRGVVRLLGMLPFVGGLAMLLGDDETSAAGRRQRHKKPHKHRKRTGNRAGKHKNKNKRQTGKPKHPDKGCKAEPIDETCAGKCGPVKNNCQKSVDCGPCDCNPPCGACEACTSDLVCESCDPCCNDVCCPQSNAACHAATGDCCVLESQSQTCNRQCGDVTNSCGLVVDCGPCTCTRSCPDCQVCDAESGDCIADPSQEGADCGDCQVCHDGQCIGCPNCCAANGVCKAGNTNPACGSSGTCDECTGQEQCQNRQCVCVPDCDGKTCGPDGCGNHCGSGCPPNATCSNDRTACVCDFRECDGTCCGQANAICHASTGACCVSESVEQTCNGQCADVLNNCGMRVDCGPCTCSPACPTCQTCDTNSGECANVSNSEPCGDGLHCKHGQCVCDGASCPDGCCQSGQCHIDDDAACGVGGGICGGCVDQGAATCGATGTCSDGQCERYASGTECQAATCMGETMLQPACTCDGQGSCDCPGPITCPNDLMCRSGACLTTCGDDDDCGSDRWCNGGNCQTTQAPGTACAAATPQQCQSGFCPAGVCLGRQCPSNGVTCDCSNLNHCSGNGCCTETCSCLCDEGWSGAACTDEPLIRCDAYPTCGECQAHISQGCTWCSGTVDGAVDVCTTVDVCLAPVEMCVCNSTSCPNGCCDAQGQCQVNAADVCGSGGGACVTCNQCGDFCDEGICQGGSCDCAALDGCSGHGCCTDTCACVCVAPWTGADCSELPPVVCADFETCEECSAHATALGCVRCSDTFDGEFTACVAAIECSFAVESCQ